MPPKRQPKKKHLALSMRVLGVHVGVSSDGGKHEIRLSVPHPDKPNKTLKLRIQEYGNAEKRDKMAEIMRDVVAKLNLSGSARQFGRGLKVDFCLSASHDTPRNGIKIKSVFNSVIARTERVYKERLTAGQPRRTFG